MSTVHGSIDAMAPTAYASVFSEALDFTYEPLDAPVRCVVAQPAASVNDGRSEFGTPACCGWLRARSPPCPQKDQTVRCSRQAPRSPASERLMIALSEGTVCASSIRKD